LLYALRDADGQTRENAGAALMSPRAGSPNRRRRKGRARSSHGVNLREQLATVLEGLVQGALGARQAQKQAYAIRSKVAICMPRAVWRLLDTMAAEEQRGHRGVVFEGRTSCSRRR
jgi:hypothetical protein